MPTKLLVCVGPDNKVAIIKDGNTLANLSSFEALVYADRPPETIYGVMGGASFPFLKDTELRRRSIFSNIDFPLRIYIGETATECLVSFHSRPINRVKFLRLRFTAAEPKPFVHLMLYENAITDHEVIKSLVMLGVTLDIVPLPEPEDNHVKNV